MLRNFFRVWTVCKSCGLEDRYTSYENDKCKTCKATYDLEDIVKNVKTDIVLLEINVKNVETISIWIEYPGMR